MDSSEKYSSCSDEMRNGIHWTDRMGKKKPYPLRMDTVVKSIRDDKTFRGTAAVRVQAAEPTPIVEKAFGLFERRQSSPVTKGPTDLYSPSYMCLLR